MDPNPLLLTPREREVVSARASGKPYKIIAYDLGISISAVGVLLWRARRKSRQKKEP